MAANNQFDIDSLIAAFAQRVAMQVRQELANDSTGPVKPRLLTVEQAATYMGRTEEAVQHMVASGKVPAVRMDRRVFIDVQDLEGLIQQSKTGSYR